MFCDGWLIRMMVLKLLRRIRPSSGVSHGAWRMAMLEPLGNPRYDSLESDWHCGILLCCICLMKVDIYTLCVQPNMVRFVEDLTANWEVGGDVGLGGRCSNKSCASVGSLELEVSIVEEAVYSDFC
jgi:hypothetical protein